MVADLIHRTVTTTRTGRLSSPHSSSASAVGAVLPAPLAPSSTAMPSNEAGTTRATNLAARSSSAKYLAPSAHLEIARMSRRGSGRTLQCSMVRE